MKNWYNLLFISLLILLVAACRTSTRSVATDKRVTQDSCMAESQSFNHQIIDLDYHVLEQIESDSSFIMVDMTWWSYPDSTGKQYPEKSANINYQANKHKGHKARDSLQRMDRQTLSTTSKQEHRESNIVRENKDQAVKPPDYGFRNIILTFLCFGVLAYLLKKRIK